MTREEAIMAVKEVAGMSLPWNDRHYEALQMAIKALEEPERKKGKWIPVMNGRGGHCCNGCNGYAPSYMNGDECLSDFCPNCGAKMELVLKMAYFIAGFIDSWRGKG